MGMTTIDQVTEYWNRYTSILEADLAKAQQENNQMRRLLYLWNHGAEMGEEGWSELHAQTEHLISRYRG